MCHTGLSLTQKASPPDTYPSLENQLKVKEKHQNRWKIQLPIARLQLIGEKAVMEAFFFIAQTSV